MDVARLNISARVVVLTLLENSPQRRLMSLSSMSSYHQRMNGAKSLGRIALKLSWVNRLPFGTESMRLRTSGMRKNSPAVGYMKFTGTNAKRAV